VRQNPLVLSQLNSLPKIRRSAVSGQRVGIKMLLFNEEFFIAEW
jgi:hypothetical protein